MIHQDYRSQGDNISEGDIALAKLERVIPVGLDDMPVLNYLLSNNIASKR